MNPMNTIVILFAFTTTAICFVSAQVSDICVQRLLPPPGDSRYTIIVPHPYLEDTLLIGQQSGLVEAYSLDRETGEMTLLNTFLDITGITEAGGERGLLGMAFHPNFDSNGRLFVSFSCTAASAAECLTDGDSAIVEFTASDPHSSDEVVLDTKKTVLNVAQPYKNHNGGQLLFSPSQGDDNLYVMLGDGGSGGDPQGNSQNRANLLGSILRLDVNTNISQAYTIPHDNPFVGEAADVREEIFAYGLRNPWRCSFDRAADHALVCGDVGQGKWEEIDVIESGKNYGWNVFEATHRFNQDVDPTSIEHTEPVFEYPHSTGRSIIGGYYHRPTSEDMCYQGVYLFADQFSGMMVAHNDRVQAVQWTCAASSPEDCIDGNAGEFYTFGEDSYGHLYFGTDKGLFRIANQKKCNLDACPTLPDDDRSTTTAPPTSSGAVGDATMMLVGVLLVGVIIPA